MKDIGKIILVCCCIFWPLSAHAQIDLEKEMNTCMAFSGEPTDSEVVDACTRLIDAAQAENETVGYFYAMRAIANSDAVLNCSDGKKAKELVDDPKLTSAIDQIINNNC